MVCVFIFQFGKGQNNRTWFTCRWDEIFL